MIPGCFLLEHISRGEMGNKEMGLLLALRTTITSDLIRSEGV